MKKIINGRKYDTETAKEIGYYGNGLSHYDLDRYEETLYQKRTGEFFIHGEGGAMTEYAYSSEDGSSYSGERIIPITEEDAREWCEHHMNADDYECIFGKVDE